MQKSALIAEISVKVTGVSCMHLPCMQWLKCKIRGGGTLYSGLGPWQWLCAFL